MVTFNSDVTVYGDGTKEPQIITGDKLSNYEWLAENGEKEGVARMAKTIGETQVFLTEKLLGLEETGPTALGPAALISIGMASKGAPGSTVVICTDGLSNIGLGAYDEAKTEEDIAKVDEFYERIAQFAQTHGTTINIVSIEGDECNLDSLARMAEMTGGNVERVNPMTLTQNFANMLAKPVIATSVVTKVKLHKGLTFRHELDANLNADKTLLVRELGNVTEDSEFTFEYTLKPIQELVGMDDLDLTKITHFPFQAQIAYAGLDGAKYLRVITNKQEISKNREESESVANHEIMMQNAIQQHSKMARGGDFRGAQAMAKCWDRKLRTNIKNEDEIDNYQQFKSAMNPSYNMI